MPTVMLALVGDQPMPNIIAALQYKPRPEHLALLVTGGEYQGIADNIARIVQGKMTCCQIKVKPFDVTDVQNACRKVAEKCEEAGQELVFNLTGGTKTMAIAAYDVAQELDKPALYVETGNQKIIHLLPANRPSQDILVRDLKIEDYLQAHRAGILLEGGQTADRTPYALALPQHCREAADYLAREAANVYHLLDMVRFRVNRQTQKDTSARGALVGKWGRRSLLDYIKDHGLSPRTENQFHEFLAVLRSPRYKVLDEFRVEENGDISVKMTEDQRQFIAGQWLEYYVFHRIKADQFEDRGVGLKVDWKDSWRVLEREERTSESQEGALQISQSASEQPRNELDVVFMRGPVFTICSCKTGQLDDFDEQQSSGKEAIFELETIARSVGLYCRKVLAISRPDFESGGDISRNFIKRALILGIAPVTARDLSAVGEIMENPAGHIESWKKRM